MTVPSRITDAELADLPLDAALDHLRDQVLATAASETHGSRVAGASQRGRRLRGLRWPVLAVAAAVAVAAVLTVPALVADHRSGPGRGDRPGGPAPLQLGFPDGRTPVPVPWEPPSTLAVLDAPGWRLDTDQMTTTPESLSLVYRRGPRAFVLTWIQTADDAENALGDGAPTDAFEVLGMPGRYFHNAGEHSVRTAPVDGYSLKVFGSPLSDAEFRELIDRLRRVTTLTMPPELVDPTEVDAVAADVYAGAELPEGFVPMRFVGWNDEEVMVDLIVYDIKCGWAQAYLDGDEAGREEVLTVLRRSPQWPLVQAVPDAGRVYDDILHLAGTSDEHTMLSSCPGAIPD